MSAMSELDIDVRAAVSKIRELQAEAAQWTEENEDICGEDDATWYDTIAWFDQRIAAAGIHLADLIEDLVGPPIPGMSD